MAPLTLEVWSDVACPWCFIGSRHLATAVDASETPIAVRWRAFQLDPALGYEGVPAAERLAEKFGDEAAYRAAAARVTDIGATVGIVFDTDAQIATNTGRAHQLVAAADEEDLADATVAALFSAYFEQGRHIGDPATLTEVATAVGLDDAATVVDDVLADRWAESVAADVADAADLGIRGVPTFVAERRVAVSGAVPPETLGLLFERVR